MSIGLEFSVTSKVGPGVPVNCSRRLTVSRLVQASGTKLFFYLFQLFMYIPGVLSYLRVLYVYISKGIDAKREWSPDLTHLATITAKCSIISTYSLCLPGT